MPSSRAVPVRAERGAQRRVMGATDWWFYPLMGSIALALIVVSLGAGALRPTVSPQRAARNGATLVYDGHALARGTQADAAHVRYVVRDLGVNARAIRLAVRPNTPAPGAGVAGVTMLLDPADTASLAGRPVQADLQIRRFSVTAAAAIAMKLDDGAWVVTPLPAQSGPVRVLLPAPAAAPRTLGIHMISDRTDLNYGAEISRITLQPAP